LRKAVDRALGGQSDDGQAELQYLQSLLRLAQLRRTPPRCLTRDGTSVTYLDFDDEGTSSNFVHSCSSRLYRIPANPDAPRFSYRPEIVFLDADGHHLPNEDRGFTHGCPLAPSNRHLTSRSTSGLSSAAAELKR
jgi:hypothetical protein